jgi:nucleotide-binding universal stress UspA family protein
MFKKILLPTDGSRRALNAARIAGQIAAESGGAVHPLVAVEFQYLEADELPEALRTALVEQVRQRATAALTAARAAVLETGAVCGDGKVVEGTSVEVILHEADAGAYDLLVLGSTGISADYGRERRLGSVTEQLLHRTPCPALVIRSPRAD